MNWKRFLVVAFALLASLSMCTSTRSADEHDGRHHRDVVTDPSGSVVPDATVTLKDQTKGATQEAKTGAQGTYRFYLLTPGPYTVSVTASGFQTTTRPVDVAVGQIAALPVSLTLGRLHLEHHRD